MADYSSDEDSTSSSVPMRPKQSAGICPLPIQGGTMAEVYAGAGGTAGETPDASNLVKVDPKEIGMSVGLKQLFSGKEDKKGRFQWQATIPEDLPKPAEDAESAKWAIIVRNVRVFHDPKKVLSMHSIVIQSPYLKDLLAEVLAEYPGVTAHLARLEFTGRFEPLIHRWSELKSAIQAMKDKRLESQKLPQTNGHSSEEVAIDAEKSEDASSDAQSSALSKDPAEQETNGNDDASLDERIKHAELLYDLLSKEFADIIESSVDMKEKGVITYELLWTLFQPGMLVYSRQQGQDRVFSLSSARYGVDRDNNPVYWLMCEYHDWDGTNFGTNRLNMAIGIFEGTRSITSLQTLPWDSHGHKADIYTKLVERGTRVEELAGSHYRSYHGIGWRLNNMGRKERYNIKGRIVIDTLGFNRFNPDMAVYVSTLNSSAKSKPSSCRRILTPSGFISLNLPPMPGSPVDDYDPGYDLEDGGMPVDGFFEDETNERPAKKPLTDQQKLLLSPLVRGYALQEKLWLNFFVTAVHDVTFNERAFDSLVLPKNQKELILGFTSTQQGYRSQFDDVIEGKGRGIILLLCGPPGVGKTLTAESVAEEMRVPLFMISSGDLGLSPRHIEKQLQDILDMCTRWNAILLLDEADVFLEERSLHELERNKLVTIFLRVLEYYEGIMFLTTNRVETFDAAFQSRIHISLEYKELDAKSRESVWQNFLRQHDIAQAAAREKPPRPLASAAKASSKRLDAAAADGGGGEEQSAAAQEAAKAQHLKLTLPHEITERDMVKLAALSMNGRQIKNILKTAQLLASQRGEGLSYKHIDTVMDVTQHLHNANRESAATKSSLFS